MIAFTRKQKTKRLYDQASEVYRAGGLGSHRRSHWSMSGRPDLNRVYRAGWDAAQSGDRFPDELPVELWAMVLAEAQRP